MPIEEALKAVAEQTEKQRVATLIMAVRSKVLEGYTLPPVCASSQRALMPVLFHGRGRRAIRLFKQSTRKFGGLHRASI